MIDTLTLGKRASGLSIKRAGNLAPVANRADNAISVLRIAGQKVTRSDDVEVRGLPEGVVFSQDGRYVHVGNCNDRDVSILRVEGDQPVTAGKSLTLPGQPAAMCGKTLF